MMARGRNGPRAKPQARRPVARVPRGRRPRRPRRNVRSFALSARAARDFLDPALHMEAPPSATSLGNSTTVNSVLRFQVGTSTTLYCMMVYAWTPGALRIFKWVFNSSTNAVTDFSDGNRKYLAFLDPASNTLPLSIRPLRMGLKMRNQTVFTSISGTVQTLLVQDPLDWLGTTGGVANIDTTGADLQPSDNYAKAIFDLVQGSPHTRTYTAMDFSSTKTFVVPPASAVGYNDWQGTDVRTASTEATPWPGAISALNVGANTNAMGTLLMIFSPSTASNLYQITCNCQDACRYSPVAIHAAFAKSQPRGDATTIHALHQIANHTPSVPTEFMGSSDYVNSAVSQVGQSLGVAAVAAAASYAGKRLGRMGARVEADGSIGLPSSMA